VPTLEELYQEHFAFVWRTVRRLGVPPALVDDAVQDVFNVAHRRLAEFEGRSSPRTWLFAIARRVVADHRRRAARTTAPLPAELEDGAAGPLESAQRAEAARLVHAILETLDEDKRAVFVLADLEQMPAPEIAQALDIGVNTVYSRLRAARAAFEAALLRLRAREERKR